MNMNERVSREFMQYKRQMMDDEGMHDHSIIGRPEGGAIACEWCGVRGRWQPYEGTEFGEFYGDTGIQLTLHRDDVMKIRRGEGDV